MTAVMVCGLSVSCEPANNDEPNEEPKEETPINPLVGTLWAEDDDDYPTYMEFTGENTVSVWGGGWSVADCNGNYRVSGNNISFTLTGVDGWGNVSRFTTGSFTNNTLRITYYSEYYDDENVFHSLEYTLTLYKR